MGDPVYALQPEPEAARRWRTLSIGGALAVGVCFGLLSASQRLPRHDPHANAERIAVVVQHTAAPELPPPPPAEQPEPEKKPEPKPKPKAKRSPPRAEVPTPPQPAAPKPMPAEAPEPEAAPKPPPLVVGLTLSSTTQGGKGPRVAVGNTLMGTVERVARQPVDRPLVTAPLAEPEERDGVSKKRTAAKLRRSTPPHYPESAKEAGVEGVVVLFLTIDEEGTVEGARVLRGLSPELDESALRAARSTLWSPATIGGEPVRTTRRFNVRFSLQS